MVNRNIVLNAEAGGHVFNRNSLKQGPESPKFKETSNANEHINTHVNIEQKILFYT
jgi:hypothetical protein